MPATNPHHANAPHVTKPEALCIETLAMAELSLGDLLQEPMDAYEVEAASDGQGVSPPQVSSPSAENLAHAGEKRVRAPSPAPQGMGQGLTRKARKIAEKRMKWKANRQEQAAAQAATPMPVYKPAPFVLARYGTPEFRILPLNADSFPAARTVFVGKHLKKGNADLHKVFTLAELEERGIAVIGWDGVTPMVILDSEDRIIAVLAGRPNGDWSAVMNAVEDAFVRARDKGHKQGIFGPGKTDDRRGDFPKLFSGFSIGTGQPKPANWGQDKKTSKIVEDLIRDANVVRVAGFQNSCFATYAPKLFAEYVSTMQALHSHHNLQQNFKKSVFAAASFNLGPVTECYLHRDSQNLPFGLCAVTSAGSFDEKKGGHIVLWELGIAVEFPSGSTILIPSAAISHCNTAIQAGETRMSMTQFCAGGLFRWVQYGFSTQEDLKRTREGRQKIAEMEAGNDERRRWAIQLFSRLPELVHDHQILRDRYSAAASAD